jgi:hypothetical protein
MDTRRISRILAPLGLLLMVLVTLGACQAIFTYTPLKDFQRTPASLTPTERITYAQDALASGDKASMLTAYDAIKADTTDAAKYAAAQLAVEISGVPDLIVTAISDPATLSGGATSITDFLTAHPDVQPEYLVEAATRLASVPKADLTPMDYVYGGLGLMLDAATQTDGTINFSSLDSAKMTVATDFINYALDPANNVVTSVSPSDPLYALLSYVQGL